MKKDTPIKRFELAAIYDIVNSDEYSDGTEVGQFVEYFPDVLNEIHFGQVLRVSEDGRHTILPLPSVVGYVPRIRIDNVDVIEECKVLSHPTFLLESDEDVTVYEYIKDIAKTKDFIEATISTYDNDETIDDKRITDGNIKYIKGLMKNDLDNSWFLLRDILNDVDGYVKKYNAEHLVKTFASIEKNMDLLYDRLFYDETPEKK